VENGPEFKTCNLCGAVWHDYEEFVVDPDLRVEGYQACFVEPDLGLILVTHMVDGCRTTLGVRASTLRPLHDGPELGERRTLTDCCLKLCVDISRLEECTADCDMAWVRSALQWLRKHELPPHLKAAS